jgi:hypothetical protein
VILKAQPQLLGLVERSGLRGGIGVDERVRVGLLGSRSVAPNWVPAPNEMSAIEVVTRVDGLARLFLSWDTRVETPVVASIDIDEQVAFNVDARRGCKAPMGVEQHREVRVLQFTSRDSCRRCGKGGLAANGTNGRPLVSHPVLSRVRRQIRQTRHLDMPSLRERVE